jgi:hypothetical protein
MLALQINQRRPDEPQPVPEVSGPRDEDFIDTSMARPGKDAAAHRRRRGALEFVEEGSMARQAEIMRLKQKYGEALTDLCCYLPKGYDGVDVRVRSYFELLQ